MPPLFICAHIALGIAALAVPAIIESTDAKCLDLTHCRTLWNILWSCFGTIFAITWVAIHRDVPDPHSGALRVTLERVAITILTLLVPECVVAWAVRQWLMASYIAKRNEKLAMVAKKNHLTEIRQMTPPSVRDIAIASDSGLSGGHDVWAALESLLLTRKAWVKAEKEATEEAKEDEKKAPAKEVANEDGGWKLPFGTTRTRLPEEGDRRKFILRPNPIAAYNYFQAGQ